MDEDLGTNENGEPAEQLQFTQANEYIYGGGIIEVYQGSSYDSPYFVYTSGDGLNFTYDSQKSASDIQAYLAERGAVPTGGTSFNGQVRGNGMNPAAATRKNTIVTHLLDARGANLSRYDVASGTIDAHLQFSCQGGFENANALRVSADDSVGVVVTYPFGNGTPNQYCAVIFDPRKYTVLGKVVLPQTQAAFDVVVTPDNRYAYVSTRVNAPLVPYIVYVIDLQSASIATTIQVPVTTGSPDLHKLAMTPDGAKIYGMGATTLTILDTATQTYQMTELAVSQTVQATALAMHPTGAKLYIFSSYNGAPSMIVVDTSSNTVLKELTFSDAAIWVNGRSNPQFSLDGRYLYAAPGGPTGTQNLEIIDTLTDSVVGQLPITKAPLYSDSFFGFFYIPPVN